MQKIILDTIKSFRKEFNVVRYEQDGLQHEGFMYGHNPTSKDLETFLKQALTKAFEAGQKSREKEIVRKAKLACLSVIMGMSLENLLGNIQQKEFSKRLDEAFEYLSESLSLTKESKE